MIAGFWLLVSFLGRFALLRLVGSLFAWIVPLFTILAGVWTALPRSVRLIIVVILVGAAVFFAGEIRGKRIVQDEWDQAKATAVQRGAEIGAKANADAEKAIPPLSAGDRAADSAVVPRGEPCRVRDIFDRSCAGR